MSERTRDEAREGLDLMVAAGLPTVALGVAALGIGLALSDWLLLPRRLAPFTSVLAVASSGVFLLLYRRFRRRPPDPRRANAWAGLMSIVVLANLIARLEFSGNPDQTSILLIFVVGISVVFLSWRWLLGLLAGAVAGWTATLVANPGREWVHFIVSLAVAVGLSVTLHAVRLRSVKAAEEERRKFRGLIEHALDVITVFDEKALITYESPSVEHVLGWTPEELLGTSVFDLIHPDDAGSIARVMTERAETPSGSDTIELRFRHKDGSWRILEAVANDGLGDPAVGGVVLNSRDVTIRKQTDARFQTLVEQIPAVTYLWKPHGPEASEWFYTSPQIGSLLGYSPEEWNADDDFWATRLHPDDRERVIRETDLAEATGKTFRMEYRYLRKDGGVVWVRDEAVILSTDEAGRPTLFQGVMFDITDRKLEEEELAKSRVQLEEAQHIARMGSWDLDLATGKAVWSAELFRIYGLDPTEVEPSRELFDGLVHPGDREMVDRIHQAAYRDHQPFAFDLRIVRPDGAVRLVHREGHVVLDAPGSAVRAVGTTQDVTEQRAAEERLRDAEERYRTLVETIPAMLYVTTASEDMREIYLSPQVEPLLGITFDLFQSQGRSWSDFVHPDDREQLERQSREFIGSGGARHALTEYRLVRPDGRVIWVQDRAELLYDDSGEPQFTQGLVFDVTAQKEAEDLLRESEAAMEGSLEVLQRTDEERRRLMARILSAEEEDRERMAVGIEDGSIQHMAAVGMRLETLKRGLSDGQQLGALDQLGRSVDKALGRLKHLLVELRPRALEADGLAAALSLYLREAGSDAGFEANLDDRMANEPDLEVRTTAYRISQEALTNVRLHAEARRVDVSLEDRDGGVAVRIADDGRGFDPETRAGGADGVGLASMRERAELTGGWLLLESAPGSGTVVEFWLPSGGTQARS